MVSRSGIIKDGFSLLELSITLLIVMILLGFALPRFPRLYESSLQLETQKLAQLLETLKQEAILNGESYKIIIDTKKSEYKVLTASDKKPDRFEPHKRFGQPIHLRDPVVFSAAARNDEQETESRFAGRKITFEKIFGQQFEVTIDSSGFVDPFTVRLNDRKNQLSLSVVNIMGKIKIGEEAPL